MAGRESRAAQRTNLGRGKHETGQGKGESSPFSQSCVTPHPDHTDFGDFAIAAERSAGVEGFQIIYITVYGLVYSEC